MSQLLPFMEKIFLITVNSECIRSAADNFDTFYVLEIDIKNRIEAIKVSSSFQFGPENGKIPLSEYTDQMRELKLKQYYTTKNLIL